jgi:hypothetical protein
MLPGVESIPADEKKGLAKHPVGREARGLSLDFAAGFATRRVF